MDEDKKKPKNREEEIQDLLKSMQEKENGVIVKRLNDMDLFK